MRHSEPLRRAVTWCAVVVHAIVASGLPLPCDGPVSAAGRNTSDVVTRLAAKDRSTPFPCMDRACGCATAEQCFTNCCCHTPRETLAWARARGTAPAVIAALERRLGNAAQASPAACCRAEKPQPAAKSCCGTSAATSRCGAEEDAPAPPAERARGDDGRGVTATRVVVLRAMLACGGIVEQWVAGGGSLPPPVVAWSCLALPCGRIAAVNDRPEPVASAPDTPPPRAA